jgi:hypothetical protein
VPVAPNKVVAPPKSVPPLNGITQVVPTIPEDDDRWEAGFVFQPENCTEADIFNPCGFTDEIWQVVVDATAGTWEFEWDGDTTPPLDFDISAFDLQTEISNFASVNFGDVIVSGGPGDDGGTSPYFITWTGQYAGIDVTDPTVNNLTLAGGAATVTPTLVQQGGEEVVKSAFFDPTVDVFFDPYIVEVPYGCSSFGWEATDYERRALDQLELGKSKAIEYEFWTGAKNPMNQSLVRGTPNDDDHILNPGGAAAPVPVSPGVALILFAQALSNCASGLRGVIHATPALMERWLNLTAVNTSSKDGGCLALGDLADLIAGECVTTTPARGDLIVGGTGYPGTGPLGQPPPGPNEVWAYATGMVNLRIGEPMLIPPTLDEALNRQTNDIEFRGEVTAAATHDGCCSFAVLVDLCGTV